jgi:tetratricopeptide (TPR) repeat protein
MTLETAGYCFVALLVFLGLVFLAWKYETWEKKWVDTLAKIAAIVGLTALPLSIIYTGRQTDVAERQLQLAEEDAKGNIKEFTAERIKEIDSRVREQKEGLRDLSQKLEGGLQKLSRKQELFVEGSVYLGGEQYHEAAERFEQVVEMEPNNKVALDLLGFSALMGAGYGYIADWKLDDPQVMLDATRAKNAFLKLIELGSEDVEFSLACAYCLLGDQENAKKQLLALEQAGKLPSTDHLYRRSAFFGPIDDETWFRNLQWAKPEWAKPKEPK